MHSKKFTTMLMLGCLVLATSLQAAAEIRKAVVTAFTEPVEWQKSGTADWKPVSLNQALGGGDKVRTGDSGNATLTLDEGSVIELAPATEFSIQTLTKDPASQKLDSVIAILRGRVRAQVTPLQAGSRFEIETPIIVAAVRGTTLNVGVGPGGEVTAFSEDGAVQLTHEGENKFTATLDTGAEGLIEYDPATGVIKVTCTKGKIELMGPDGILRTLVAGDTVVFSGGAATFIPAVAATADAPPSESIAEPASVG